MPAFSLRVQLQNYMQDMYNEGMINGHFIQIQLKKERSHPQTDQGIRAIIKYCVACTTIFPALSQLIDQEEVDFQSVHFHASDLYARSCSLGLRKVRSICTELLQACERKDKNECSQALYRLKHGVACLRIKFESLVQIQRRIIELESNG